MLHLILVNLPSDTLWCAVHQTKSRDDDNSSVRQRVFSKNRWQFLRHSDLPSRERSFSGSAFEHKADGRWKCGAGLDLVLDSPPAPTSCAGPVGDRRDTNSEAVRLLMSGTAKKSGADTAKTMGLEAAVQAAANRPTPRPQPLPPPKTIMSSTISTPRTATACAASGPNIPLPGPRWEKLPAQVVESATALRPAKLGFKKRGLKLRGTRENAAPRLSTPPKQPPTGAVDTPTAILQGGLQSTISATQMVNTQMAQPVNWERPEKKRELDFVRQMLQQTTSKAPGLALLGSARTAGSQAHRHLRDFERTFMKGKAQSVQSARPAVRLKGQHTVLKQRHLMQHQRVGAVA